MKSRIQRSGIIKKETKLPDLVIHFIVVIMIGFSFYKGFEASARVGWVFDKDMIRNVSMAQGVFDGYPLSDPTYYGETIWYNPMVPALTAAVSKITGASLISVNMKIGAFINILVPVAFYLFLLCFFSPLVAAGGTFAMLFIINNHIATYMSGTYSAVTYAMHLAPGFFFLALIFYIKARQTDKNLWFILCGCALGLTFLAHTAPVVIFLGVVFVDMIICLFKKRKESRLGIFNLTVLGKFLLIGIFAMLTASPLLYSILLNYQLRVINRAPMRVVESILRVGNFKSLINAIMPNPVVLLIILAGLVVLLKKCREIQSKILIILFCVILFFISYTYLKQVIGNTFDLPQVVPGLHFFQYFGFMEAIFFGIGLGFLIESMIKIMRSSARKIRFSSALNLNVEKWMRFIVLTAFLIPAFFYFEPEYASRWDFRKFKKASSIKGKDISVLNQWLVANVKPQEVMLNDEGLPATVIMAGRKFVSNPAKDAASNAFVDYLARVEDRDDMIVALENKDYGFLYKSFKRYHVDYILENMGSSEKHWYSPGFLQKLFRYRKYAVYRINYELLIKSLQKKGDGINKPYMMLLDKNVFHSVTVLGLDRRNFNYIEKKNLGNVMVFWRWIDSTYNKQSILKAFENLRCGSIIIMKRKDLMAFLYSEERARLNRADLAFCGFSTSRKVPKGGRKYPEKVIVFCEGSGLQNKIRDFGLNLFKLSEIYELNKKVKMNIDDYIQQASLLVFNSGMHKKYANDWGYKLKQGLIDKKGFLSLLLKQASHINY